MGRGGSMGEVLSLSGIFKVFEVVLLFVVTLIHRHGDHGKYIFFGSSAIQMKANYYDKGDAGMDLENLGNGTLVTFMVISSVLLICYVLDGRFAIQSLFLEWLWNLLGFFMTTAVGVNSLIVWTNARSSDTLYTSGLGSTARNYTAALSMGALLVIVGLIYFVDFIIAVLSRKRIERELY